MHCPNCPLNFNSSLHGGALGGSAGTWSKRAGMLQQSTRHTMTTTVVSSIDSAKPGKHRIVKKNILSSVRGCRQMNNDFEMCYMCIVTGSSQITNANVQECFHSQLVRHANQCLLCAFREFLQIEDTLIFANLEANFDPLITED